MCSASETVLGLCSASETELSLCSASEAVLGSFQLVKLNCLDFRVCSVDETVYDLFSFIDDKTAMSM